MLGEYDKEQLDPSGKLSEELRAAAFRKHTYGHTPMGFLEDIKDMPSQYDYSLQFYNRFYRPEYTTIILVGDLTRQRALELTRNVFGDWKRGNYVPDIPAEPQQVESRSATVDWSSPTLPLVSVGFHGPASPTRRRTRLRSIFSAPSLLVRTPSFISSSNYKRAESGQP